MSDRRLRRFTQLEQSRNAAGDIASPSGADDAASAAAQPEPACDTFGPTPAQSGNADADRRREERFLGLHTGPSAPLNLPADLRSRREEQQETGSGLALDDDHRETQPFRRCAQCGADSGRHATECRSCHADLRTEAQERFNEEVWAMQRATRETESVDDAARAREQLEHSIETAKAQRVMYENMARQVGERERARFDTEGLFSSRQEVMVIRLFRRLTLGAVTSGGLFLFGSRASKGLRLVFALVFIACVTTGVVFVLRALARERAKSRP